MLAAKWQNSSKPKYLSQARPVKPCYRYAQSGFTLVELMISLVLGLLITAAAMQVYYTNYKTSTIQRSGSELQQSSIFGLAPLEANIRLANLGNDIAYIDDETVQGGVVLTGCNLGIYTLASAKQIGDRPPKYQPLPDACNPKSESTEIYKKDIYAQTSSGYLTRTGSESSAGNNKTKWTGVSNIKGIGSDQLTIQYKNISNAVMSDCEGGNVEIGDTVVERYFLRLPTGVASDNNKVQNLVLACDAGRVNVQSNGGSTIKTFTPATDPRNFGQAGQELIRGVDQFVIALGVQQPETTKAEPSLLYITTDKYKSLSPIAYDASQPDYKIRPPIVAIRVGLIMNGGVPILADTDKDTFTLFGQSMSLKTDTSRSKQVRTAYETSILLRNARVITLGTDLK